MALLTAITAITRKNAIHALLYMILSLLSVSIIFYILGAPFMAALEIIIYAGAIMVLFIFVIMMLNVGLEIKLEEKWQPLKLWLFPFLIAAALLALFIIAFDTMKNERGSGVIIGPEQVGYTLFKTYLLGVEISGILLMVGIIGAYHLGRQRKNSLHRFLQNEKNN
jgi:NADH-quinone oxidoreductase subunit J